jgi:hypothetical protein
MLPDTNDNSGSSSSSSTLMAQHLLAAADRYGLDRLRLLCESKLCEDVSTDTVATTLALAEQHHASQLKAVCLKYAATNLAGLCLAFCHTLRDEHLFPAFVFRFSFTVEDVGGKTLKIPNAIHLLTCAFVFCSGNAIRWL